MHASLQYLDGSNTPSTEGDGQPVVSPLAGDYSGDVSYIGIVTTGTLVVLGQPRAVQTFYSPSPFILVRDIDPNQPPSTRSGFFPGYE
jgi:hypothetical protein